MTVQELLEKALEKCRIKNPSTEMLSKALGDFNLMLKSLNEELIFPTSENFTLTVGTESYSIGDGGDFDTIRPLEIKSAFLRDSDDVDHPLNVDISKEDYDKITDKDYSTRPSGLYYAPEYPLGYIYFDTAPAEADTLYLYSVKPFAEYTTLTTDLTQPVEMEKFLIFNLAIDIAPAYGISLPNTLLLDVERMRDQIERRYAKPTPLASFDEALTR